MGNDGSPRGSGAARTGREHHGRADPGFAILNRGGRCFPAHPMCRQLAGKASQSTRALDRLAMVGGGSGSSTKVPAAIPTKVGRQPVS